MRGIGAKIDLVVTLGDIERLGESPGAGAKAPGVFDAAAPSHDRKATPRLERADENDPVARSAFDKHIQHPVHPVVEINVSSAWFIELDERARAGARKGVTRFVALNQIGFRLND